MATEKEQVQEFSSIVSLHQYVEGIDFDALSAAKAIWMQRQGGCLHVTVLVAAVTSPVMLHRFSRQLNSNQ